MNCAKNMFLLLTEKLHWLSSEDWRTGVIFFTFFSVTFVALNFVVEAKAK